MFALRVIKSALTWGFPIVFVATSYLLSVIYLPAMLQPLSVDVLQDPGIAWGLLAQLVVAVIWIIVGAVAASHMDTRVTALKTDAVFGLSWALVASGVSVWLLSQGTLSVWMPIIAAACVVEGYSSTVLLAINNAAQKPITALQGASA